MIPLHVIKTIKARHPDAKVLLLNDETLTGFGVELGGQRNAWLVRYHRQWDTVLERAMAWLAERAAESADASMSGAD